MNELRAGWGVKVAMSLRHRTALSALIPASLKRLASMPQSRRKVVAAAHWAAELLETRVMLTTLHGGDQLVFINEDGNFQTVAAFGNITAEVIGANVDGNNNVVLEDLPGQFDGANVGGGFAIPGGATLVGTFNISNPGGPAITAVPSSIAVDQNGNMYGIVIQTIQIPPVPPATMTTATNLAYLVSIDKNTGQGTTVAEISQQILAAAGITPGTPGALVTAAPAATFDPANGLLYIAADTGVAAAGGGAAATTQSLVTINPNAGNIGNSVSGIPGNFNGNPISSLTFSGGKLFGAGGMNVVGINTQNTNNISSMVTTTVNGPISGIAAGPGGQVYAITNNAGASSEVYVINPNNGNTLDYGPLPTGNLGQNPGDLTYDPTSGNLYSFDTQTDQLFIVSPVNRTRYLSIFQIYISQSDSTGEIVTSIGNAGGAMTPYGAGIIGALRVTNAQTGMVNLIASPAGSGDALIGARTRVITAGGAGAANFPLLTGTVTVVGESPYTIGQSITAGVVSGPGTAIGEVLVSGPVMGDVHLGGSIDTFYAGWLLTGDTGGEPATNIVSDPGNFTVLGDLRNLLVSDAIGTDSDTALTAPTYVTGFDMHVGGTIGRVQSFDSIVGNINDSQSPTAQNLTTNLFETEQRTTGNAHPWNSGLLGGNAAFNNDTFATAQDLGTLPTSVNGLPSAVVLDGNLQADAVQQDWTDYYGVALMAGQTITVQVVQLIPPPLVIDLAVFNPDGDLIASDYNQVDFSQTQQMQFRFTADRPGVYRFAVATTGNATFTTAGNTLVPGDIPYQLTIQGAGDVAVGAIVATNNILDNVDPMEPEPSFGTQVGDLGAVSAGNDILSSNGGNTIDVTSGNLRDVDAGSIGIQANPPFDPEIQVPLGSVGLVSATSATGVLIFNYPAIGLPPAIGGNYQIVSSATDFAAKLIADGSIGVLRAANMTLGTSVFQVNAGNSTTPGNIDLIDVTGDLGTLTGGPHIITGPQGNVGYMRVGGTTYRDATFGGGTPEATLYQPGESVTLTDDSGAQVVITPTGTPSIPANGGGPSNDTSGTTVNPNLPQLTITAYPIEGSGGVAIENVTSTGGVTITGTGQEAGQTVQIGVIDAQGLGQTLNQLVMPPNLHPQPTQPSAPGTTTGTTTSTTTAPTFFTGPDTAGPVGRTNPLPNPPVLNPNSASPLNVILTGSARMDAFEVDGGLFSSITDSTGGDVVNVNAQSIGTLSSNGQIGLSQNHTGAALNGMTMVANTFPLIDAHNAITVGVAGGVTPGGAGPVNPITTTTVVNGTTTTTTTTVINTPAVVAAPEVGIANIIATQGLGNINVIGTMVGVPGTANSVGDGFIGTIQGSILGPVFASGSIYSVVLGSAGIANSGSGAGSQAGIYAQGQIGTVTNSAPCDIRGAIVSDTGVTGIKLNNGSIINATLGNLSSLDESVQLPVGRGTFTTPSPITNPVLDVGNIIVSGNGGIIGAAINGQHIGHIDVYHGFGMFESAITVVGDGTLAGILADGYGIRGVTFIGGSSAGQITATGNGRNISTQVYSANARLSEVDTFDPFFGLQPNLLTDIDISTTATAQVPQVPGFDGGGTDSGVIQDCTFEGNRTLAGVRAYQIRATDPVAAPTTFNFGNNIGSIITRSNDDGIAVITGRMTSFHPGGNIDHLTFQIAGPINNLNIAGNVTSASVISATGRNGNIGKLHVGGTLQGSITASRRINSATIGGNLTGTVSAKQINTLKVFGTLNGGNLDIQGNVNNVTFVGDLGLPSETLTIHGSVKTLKIGGNLNANVTVEGSLGTLQVGQSVLSGTLTDVAKTLNLLSVAGDVQAGATIEATLIRHQKIQGMDLGTIIG